MRMLSRIILAFVVNAVILYVSAYFLPDFVLNRDMQTLAMLAAALTLLNLFLRPALKMILAPFILLTLGLGLIVLNGVILKVLDIMSPELTIQGIPALIYATLIMSAANIIFHLATRHHD